MNSLKQIHVAGAVKALSLARLRNYRTFFAAADDRAAYGLYCWNEAISSALSKVLGFTEIALRNQFHAALSSRYGVGTTLSRDWYAHLRLNQKSADSVRKITHGRRRVGRAFQLVPHIPAPSPDDVVSKLTFGFWPHILDVTHDNANQALDWSAILVDVAPGHRHNSNAFWSRQKHRDALFARIDFCKDLRNRIAHLEPVWKAGPLMTEGRPRTGVVIRVEHSAPSTPREALSRLQTTYDRVLDLLKWLSPDLHNVYMAGEAHPRFTALNQIPALEAYRRHGGHRRVAPVDLNSHRSLRRLKKEFRNMSPRHGAAEVCHNGRPIAWWIPIG
jgi:hypothetical protein